MNEHNKNGPGQGGNPPPKLWQLALAGVVLAVLVGIGAWTIYSTSNQFIATPATPPAIEEARPAPPAILGKSVAPVPTPAPIILRDKRHPIALRMKQAALPWQRLAGAANTQPIASAAIPWHAAKPPASLPPYAAVPWKRLETRLQSTPLATLPWQRSGSALAEHTMPISAAAVPWRPASPSPAKADSIASAKVPWRQDSAQTTPIRMSYAAVPWPHDSTHPKPVNVSYAALTPYLAPMHAYAPPHFKVWDPEPAQLSDLAPLHPKVLLASISQDDPKLAAWVSRWISQPTTDEQRKAIGADLQATTISSLALFRIGQGIAYIDGQNAAIPWFCMSVERAKNEFESSSLPMKSREEIAHALAVMSRPLFAVADYNHSLIIHDRLAEYFPKRSANSRRAAFMRVECLFYLAKFDDAVATVRQLESDNADAGDLPPEDLHQMHWLNGVIYYSAGKYADAITNLQQAMTGPNASLAASVPGYLCLAYAHEGKRELAVDMLQRAIRAQKLPEAQAKELAFQVQQVLTETHTNASQ
ncbi:MAG TPA: hypothetical protein VIL86_03295 [Tepidisphaeraceae bacterium]